MKLYLSDLKLIGMHTFKDKNEFCVFISEKATAAYDFLLIRSILEENGFGRLSYSNFIDLENGYFQIDTNYLYNQYLNLK